MKRNFIFAALIATFAMAASASAQTAPNFSGTWTLDTAQSKLGERNNIESQTLTVWQNEKDIKVSTTTKRMAPPAGAPAGGPPPGGGGRMGGDTSVTYTLDGAETTVEMDSPMGKMPVKYVAKIEGGKLNLGSSRTMNGPNGEMKMSSKENWTISADGTTLNVETESTGMRGTTTTSKVFKKKVS